MSIVTRRKSRGWLKGRAASLNGALWQYHANLRGPRTPLSEVGQTDLFPATAADAGELASLNPSYGTVTAYDLSTPGFYAPSAPVGSSSSGGISASDAALLSTAITTAGKVGTQAIVGTPTVTYNPLTGTYMATGGAAIPAGLTTSTAITEYLPYLLLFGGIFLVISMGRR
jgi:hypothetical protein